MRQAWSKEYAHELVEMLPGSQVNGAIEMLESMVGTRHVALVDVAPEEGSLGEDQEILGHGEMLSHAEFLAESGGTGED
jgi:hypothetical protein